MKSIEEKDIIFVGHYKHLPIFLDTDDHLYFCEIDDRDEPFPPIAKVKNLIRPVEDLPEKDQIEIYLMFL